MKIKFLSKVTAAVLMMVAIAASLTMKADVNRKIKVIGPDEKTIIGVYETSDVSYIEVVEVEKYPTATIESNGNILIELTPEISFRMIQVEGGVDYALQNADIIWTTVQKTNRIETFYLGEFEVTQSLWKNIIGSVPPNQSATGDNFPVAQVSWEMIAGSAGDTFLKLINAKLAEIKNNYSAVATLLGSREFRLPSEWELEYAAAGGKRWATLKYYFSGTSGTTNAELNKVAVNSVSSALSSVATVGSKNANALGLYDMSGNVAELCSGLGYPDHKTTPGYLSYNDIWSSSKRHISGGSWSLNDIGSFRISTLSCVDTPTSISKNVGFRLAL